MHPQFSRSNYKQFVTGGNKVRQFLLMRAGITCSFQHFLEISFLNKSSQLCPVKTDSCKEKKKTCNFDWGEAGAFVWCESPFYFSVSLVECSRQSWPFSQSAVLATVFQADVIIVSVHNLRIFLLHTMSFGRNV